MNKIRAHAWLLKQFRKTGDKDYLAAAGRLRIPLLEDLQHRQRYLRTGRGQTVGKQARPRLYRMARMVTAGLSVRKAARQEVNAHGRGDHASDDAAIDHLRHRYTIDGAYIESTIAIVEELRAQWREFDRAVDRLRGPAIPPELLRGPAIPPELLRGPAMPSESLSLQRARWWKPHWDSFLRSPSLPRYGGRNIRPKTAEKKSQDMG